MLELELQHARRARGKTRLVLELEMQRNEELVVLEESIEGLMAGQGGPDLFVSDSSSIR